MINLAGVVGCDVTIRDELTKARISIVEGVRSEREVSARLTGELRGFAFTRAWYYWVVWGDMPITEARALYADPLGRTDIRVAGHCGCPPPDKWCTHFDADGYELYTPTEMDRACLKEWPKTHPEIMAVHDARHRASANPAASAALSVVTNYHIDSLAGLRVFADTILLAGLKSYHRERETLIKAREAVLRQGLVA
jgi:hypothetical protein